MIESSLVLAYHTSILPTATTSKWSQGEKREKPTKASGVIWSGVAVLLTWVLMFVGSQDTALQRLIINLINPVIVAVVGFAGSTFGKWLKFHNPLLGVPVVIGAGLVFAAVVYGWNVYNTRSARRKVQATTTTDVKLQIGNDSFSGAPVESPSGRNLEYVRPHKTNNESGNNHDFSSRENDISSWDNEISSDDEISWDNEISWDSSSAHELVGSEARLAKTQSGLETASPVIQRKRASDSRSYGEGRHTPRTPDAAHTPNQRDELGGKFLSFPSHGHANVISFILI